MKPSLEKTIIEYFNVINSEPYKELKLFFVENRELVIITLYVDQWKDSWVFHRTHGKEYPLLQSYSHEMEEIFPYDFRFFCTVLNP